MVKIDAKVTFGGDHTKGGLKLVTRKLSSCGHLARSSDLLLINVYALAFNKQIFFGRNQLQCLHRFCRLSHAWDGPFINRVLSVWLLQFPVEFWEHTACRVFDDIEGQCAVSKPVSLHIFAVFRLPFDNAEFDKAALIILSSILAITF